MTRAEAAQSKEIRGNSEVEQSTSCCSDRETRLPEAMAHLKRAPKIMPSESRPMPALSGARGEMAQAPHAPSVEPVVEKAQQEPQVPSRPGA